MARDGVSVADAKQVIETVVSTLQVKLYVVALLLDIK